MTLEPIAALRDTLLRRIDAHEASIGIIGQGYVGLPLALTFATSATWPARSTSGCPSTWSASCKRR